MIRFPPKSILVACDLSESSRTAWRHAAALAARCGAALEAVYVVPADTDDAVVSAPALDADYVRELTERIRALIGPGHRITVLHGDPTLRLLGLARLHRWDLIVVGTHGRKGLKRALFGSVAEDVLRGAPVPVLVARGRVRPVRAILSPVNFTPYAERGFVYAAAAAAALSARLTALHVTEDPIWSGDPRPRLAGFFKRLPPRLSRRCRPAMKEASGDVVKGILAARRGHDWIVLAAHRGSLLVDAFAGTTLERVLHDSPTPVLSVPDTDAPVVCGAERSVARRGRWASEPAARFSPS